MFAAEAHTIYISIVAESIYCVHCVISIQVQNYNKILFSHKHYNIHTQGLKIKKEIKIPKSRKAVKVKSFPIYTEN